MEARWNVTEASTIQVLESPKARYTPNAPISELHDFSCTRPVEDLRRLVVMSDRSQKGLSKEQGILGKLPLKSSKNPQELLALLQIAGAEYYLAVLTLCGEGTPCRSIPRSSVSPGWLSVAIDSAFILNGS